MESKARATSMDTTDRIRKALAAGPTEGPWRWEINLTSKRVHLVGGKPQYDLTVIDFERWGMSNATMRLREVEHDGLNLMHKVHERTDWIEPFPGREHHAEWCANVTHPDAEFIAACNPAAIRSLIDRAESSEKRVGELSKAGTLMSNAMFNWSQDPGRVATDRDCSLMKQMQVAWDAALKS